MNGRERVLSCLEGKAVDRPPLMPITMMLAAERVGVPYRRYATEHSVLVEAQLRIAEAFEFDHVSCISDPVREAADCGAKIRMFDDQPPALLESEALLADRSELSRLELPDPLGGGRMHDRVRAAERFRQLVGGDKAIEGWVEGPCALGANLRGIHALMLDLVDEPGFVLDLFEVTLELALRFARVQVDAGCDLVGVGDAAASLIGAREYGALVWPYEKRLVDGIHAMGVPVRLHICGRTIHLLPGMGRLRADLVDLDAPTPMRTAREVMGDDQVLAGNVDPVRVVRDGRPDAIRAALAECHRGAGAAYVIAAGCELPRGTPAENVRALTDYARLGAPALGSG